MLIAVIAVPYGARLDVDRVRNSLSSRERDSSIIIFWVLLERTSGGFYEAATRCWDQISIRRSQWMATVVSSNTEYSVLALGPFSPYPRPGAAENRPFCSSALPVCYDALEQLKRCSRNASRQTS